MACCLGKPPKGVRRWRRPAGTWDHDFCSNTSVLYCCFPILTLESPGNLVKLRIWLQWAWGRAEILQFPQARSWCWYWGPLRKRWSVGFFPATRSNLGITEDRWRVGAPFLHLGLGQVSSIEGKGGKGKLRCLRGAISQGLQVPRKEGRRRRKQASDGQRAHRLKIGSSHQICWARQIKNKWCSFQRLIYECT